MCLEFVLLDLILCVGNLSHWEFITENSAALFFLTLFLFFQTRKRHIQIDSTMTMIMYANLNVLQCYMGKRISFQNQVATNSYVTATTVITTKTAAAITEH